MVFEIGVWFPASDDQATHLNLSIFKIKNSQINPAYVGPVLDPHLSWEEPCLKIRTDGLICYSRARFISAGAKPGSRHDKAGEGVLEVSVFISWNCCLRY